jgi:hypothetical protein
MIELDALKAQVQANTDAEASAIEMINGLAAKIAELASSGATPAELQALSDQLKASADALGAAILANTEVVPVPLAPSTDTPTTPPTGDV